MQCITRGYWGKILSILIFTGLAGGIINLSNNNISQTLRNPLGIKMEISFKNGRGASLDILHKVVTQQEINEDLSDDHPTFEVLLRWSKCAKLEVTRQRL